MRYTLVVVLFLGACANTPTLPTVPSAGQSPAPTAPHLEASGILQTPTGPVYYKTNGAVTCPCPTILVFAGAADEALGPTYGDVAAPLIQAGWVALSVDAPGHGSDVRPGEPGGSLSVWAMRVAQGEDIAAVFVARVSQSLDALVSSGVVDPHRIVATGISRGGWLALQMQAGDRRVGKVAALQPVTDLRALEEFNGVGGPLVARLSAAAKAPQYHAPLWVIISSTDTRVSTQACREFVAQARQGVPVDYTETGETTGHTYPAWAPQTAASWLLEH